MLVLAIDSSSDMLCCALARTAKGKPLQLLGSKDHLCRRQSNVELVSCCQELVAEQGLTMSNLDAVVTGRGPGSFTGVRIGVATAKGLSCGLEKPLYGVSTLDAVAWNAWLFGVRGKLAVAADAMRGEVYPGIYELVEAGPERLFAAETVAKADACVAAWQEHPNREALQLAGDGLFKYRERFEAAGLVRFVPEELWRPSGTGLLHAFVAQEATMQDGVTTSEAPHTAGDPALVLPIYTRLSDAEENERKKLGLATPASLATTGTFDALADRHLQLRPMLLNDLEQVASLEAEVFADSAHEPWSAQLFYEELSQPGRTWWVASDAERIVGFAGGILCGESIEVADIAVAPTRRHQKIASRLLERLAYDGQMLNASQITLEVYEHNEPAIALYQSCGFEQKGTRPNYYGQGKAALIMTATLPLRALTDEQNSTTQLRRWPLKHPARTAEQEARRAAAGKLVLAIESSCDETAVAVLSEQGEALSSIVATQIDFHARFGGVVPEIASRKHTEAIVGCYEEALAEAGRALDCPPLTTDDLSAIAVTSGPGLVGALVVGVAFAKGLCAATGLPLIAVNHLEGHLYANLFETPDLMPPFVASLVSGGNTMLVHVRDWGHYHIMGETIDDAVGEAFDKVAKTLGLGYPGGPVISKLAAQGNPRAIAFPRAMMHTGDYRFSLSGLKTAVITYIEGEQRAGRAISLPDLAASFQAAVVDVQVAKALAAVEETGVRDFCLGGGVAANPALRTQVIDAFTKRGVRVTVPPFDVCGDNAAMIGLVALRKLAEHDFAPLTLDADPNLRLSC